MCVVAFTQLIELFMNIFTLTRNHLSASFLALVTIASLLLSALPAAFFVAEAATQNVTIGVSMVPSPSTSPDTIMLSNPASFEVTIEDLVITDLASSNVFGPSDVTIAANATQILMVDDRLNIAADDITFSGTNVTTNTVSYTGSPATDVAVTGSFVITADDGVVTSTEVEEYSNDFENNTVDWAPFGGTITQVSTETGGILSQCGDGHAVIDGSVFSRWGGYADTFPVGGYTTEIDVYLDMALADGSDKGFDFSSAVNSTDINTHRRDFIFHLETNASNPGTWLVNVSNNAPGNPSASGDSGVIDETGWYTLQAYFHDNGSGVLEVTMNVIDRSTDSVVFTKNRSDASDIIGTTVGGNRYGWFTGQRYEVGDLAIDNAALYLGSPVQRDCESDIVADTTKPIGTIDSPEDNSVVGSSFSVNGTAFDGESGLAEVLYRVNEIDAIGGLFVANVISGTASGTETWSYAVNGLSEGFYRVRAEVIDNAGNIRFLHHDVEVDTTKPTVTITSPSNQAVLDNVPFTVTGTASDAKTGIKEVKYTVTNITGIGGTFVDLIASSTATGRENWSFGVPALENGFYRLKVQAFDEVGNWRYEFHDIEVKGTRAFISVINPADGFIAYEDFEITVNATDGFGLGQVVINLKDEDGDNLAPCLNVQAGGVTDFTASCTVDVDSLEPGIYGFRTNARDLEGNISNTVSQTFEVRELPVASLTITAPTTDGATVADAGIFTAEYIDNDLTADSFQWAIRAGTCERGQGTIAGNVDGFDDESTFVGTTFTAQFDATELEDGEYCFVVNPREQAGEQDLRATRTFVVETPLLTCEITSDTGTLIIENNEYAVETYEHRNWTALIPGATWVWETFYVEDPTVNTTRTFTETFVVNGIDTATLDVAADNGYQLFVNDQLVQDRRSIENNFQTHTQKTFDIAEFLVDGENTFTIEVTNKGVQNANALQNPAGVLYKLVVSAETACEITTEPADDTAPTITVKEGSAGGPTEFTEVSFALFDAGDIDKLTLNGVEKDLTNNPYSDLNFVTPGQFGAVLGTNTLVVFDATGNSTTFIFTLIEETTENPEGPGDGDPETPTEGEPPIEPPITTPGTPEPESDNNSGGNSSGTLIPSLAQADFQPLVLGASTGQCGMLITDYLRMGIENDPNQVRWLQFFLFGQGYFDVTVNGEFDAATDAAVRAFQEKHRADILDPWVTNGILTVSNPTGWVYQLTRYKINNIICPGSEPMPSLI